MRSMPSASWRCSAAHLNEPASQRRLPGRGKYPACLDLSPCTGASSESSEGRANCASALAHLEGQGLQEEQPLPCRAGSQPGIRGHEPVLRADDDGHGQPYAAERRDRADGSAMERQPESLLLSAGQAPDRARTLRLSGRSPAAGAITGCTGSRPRSRRPGGRSPCRSAPR